MSYYPRRRRTGTFYFFVPIIALFLVLTVGCGAALHASKEQRGFTLEHIERGSDNKPALAFTSVGVFSIEDSFLLLHFNSSDVYGELARRKGQRLTCTVAGWRIRFASQWENILDCES